MSRLEIALLGAPEIKIDGQPIKTDRRKSIALLAYLAVTGRSHPRGALAAFFWPDYEQSSAYAYLRRTLWELNQMLGEGWLEVDRSTVRMAADTDHTLDTAEFAQLTAAKAKGDRVALTQAISLYRGDFMAGFEVADTAPFEAWQSQQARQFSRLFAGALERLIEYETRDGEYESALLHAYRWLALEPLDEAAHRALMQLFAWLGERVKAVQQYESCCQILDDELGITPQLETTQLYEKILHGDITTLGLPPAENAPVEPRPSSHLPILPTPFIGRRPDVERVKALLDHPHNRLITMIGPGGIGKTRLSIQACSEVEQKYRDGVFFVSLAPVQSPDDVLLAIAKALSFSFYQETVSQRQQLLDFLREKQLLLILDNFEHVAAAAGLVAEILAFAVEVQLMVTSRARLNLPGEQLYPVGGMHIPEVDEVDEWTELETEAGSFSAVQLFLDRARRVQPAFALTNEDVPAVVQICRLVEGMPLALELAAAWLQLLQPTEIAAEIERSLDFLEADQVGIPDRQRSIRAVFESSWTLLSAQKQETFLYLCVFVGTFTREAAQQVSDASLRTLLGLVNKSWLQQTAGGRFQLHELMRQYGGERLRADEADWRLAKERHANHFAGFVGEQSMRMMGTEQLAGLKALAAEHSTNVKAAWDWLVSERRWDELIEQMLLGLFQFGVIRWEIREIIPWLRTARLELVEEMTQSERLAFAIFGTFEVLAEELAGIKDATPLERVGHLWRFVHDHELVGAMGVWFVFLAGIVRARNLAPDAERHIADTIARLRNQNDQWQLGMSLLIAANWLEPDSGIGDGVIEAGTLFGELGAPYWQGVAAELSGKRAFQKRQPFAEVIAHYDDARWFLQQLEGHCRPGLNFLHLPDIYIHQGEFEKAFSLFREEQRELERRGNKHILGMSLQWEALHAARYSTFDHALSARRRRMELSEALGNQSDIPWQHFELGEIYRIFGQPAQALTYYQLARPGFASMKITLGLAFDRRANGDLVLEKKQYGEALALYRKYYRYAQEDNHQWSMSQARARMALVQAYLGKVDPARRELKGALTAMYEVREDDLALQAMLAEAVCLVHEGKASQAIELASFLQHHHLSWNETKRAAREILKVAATGLDDESVQAAVERGKRLQPAEILEMFLTSGK